MGSEIAFRDIAQLVRNVIQPEALGDVPYIGLEHIDQGTLRLNEWGHSSDVHSAKFYFQRGDILFGKLRPYFRKVIRAPFDGICSTDIWVVRAKEGFDQGYLYYWMASPDFVNFANTGAEGTRMPRAKWEHVERFTRPYLPIIEQRAIAHILGTLDDKIEMNRRMNETLEAMAQALFKSWFVDFDPVVVNAIQAGNPVPEKFAARAAHYRQNPDALGLPDHIQRLFPDRFVDSELGPIPEGWEVGKIKNCCTKIQNGGTPNRSEANYWEPGVIPWLTSGEVRKRFITKTENMISELGLKNSSAKWLPKDSTVVALYGATAGQVAFISSTMTTNQAVCGLIPKPGFRYYNFLYLDRSMNLLSNLARGSAQQNISKGIIETIKVVFPGESIITLFDQLIYPLFGKWASNLNKSNTLAALRDTLLPKLISGELRVPDVEKFLTKAEI